MKENQKVFLGVISGAAVAGIIVYLLMRNKPETIVEPVKMHMTANLYQHFRVWQTQSDGAVVDPPLVSSNVGPNLNGDQIPLDITLNGGNYQGVLDYNAA